MPRRPLLEVIVESVEDAVAAARGGADRLEIVRALDRGGLTPPPDLVRAIAAAVHIPARAMVRVEEPFVPSSPEIVARLAADARALADTGVEGIVVGILDADHRVDEAALRTVLAGAPRLRATFHRAFEVVADAGAALATLDTVAQVDTVLVNGGSGRWDERRRRLTDLAAAAGRIRILAAVGLDPDVLDGLDPGWPFDVHVGRAAREPQEVDAPVSTARVRRLAAQVLQTGA